MSAEPVEFELGAAPLTLRDYQAVVSGHVRARLSEVAARRMTSSRASLMRQLARGVRMYGVNTGYGADSVRTLEPDAIRTVQRNTVLSHAVGAGPPAAAEIVRGMLLLKANVLSKGYSAVRPAVAELLLELLNRDVLPIVPEQGSLAASGDLVPSGHLALTLIGEGDVLRAGRRETSAEALSAEGLQPLTLEEKEGLALVNGTVFTESYALAALTRADNLLLAADVAGAATLQALKGHPEAFAERALAARPFAGSLRCAANLRDLCHGSELLGGPPDRVHDPYCLRCMPQVHGASRDALQYVKTAVLIELDAFTDNPLVFDDDDTWVSAGNFHAQPVGLAMDTLAVLVAELASISQRRTQHLVAPVYEVGLPSKLSPHPELGSGLFMLNTTAAALVSENKAFSFPASVDSMAVDTTEDHVSMASVAARKSMAIIANTANVLAIEIVCACQAIDLHSPLKPSPPIEALRGAVRKTVPFVEHDRALSEEVAAIAGGILSGAIVDTVREVLGRSLD